MTAIVIACAGFLLAVLWMDLMFDVQVLRHRDAAEIPEPTLASIAAYYRRVTTDANPMGHLIGVVMLIAVVALLGQIWRGEPRWVGLLCLPLTAAAAGFAVARVLPNAARLGSRVDSIARQSELARAMCRDHLLCLAAIVVMLGLQLYAA